MVKIQSPWLLTTIGSCSFKLLINTILGTLSKVETDKYDLILTNPPYVTSGSSNYKHAIKDDGKLSNFYKIKSLGIEGLFLQWVIRSLKPSKKALVLIIPYEILNRLNDDKLRTFINEECIIDGIISLPKKAFYRNLIKTYILVLTKKQRKNQKLKEKSI